LHADGWLRHPPVNNRKAKFYDLSKAGRKQLVAETENWQRISGVIGRLLQLDPRT
jgi:PadR family transcriptional regulator PadR